MPSIRMIYFRLRAMNTLVYLIYLNISLQYILTYDIHWWIKLKDGCFGKRLQVRNRRKQLVEICIKTWCLYTNTLVWCDAIQDSNAILFIWCVDKATANRQVCRHSALETNKCWNMWTGQKQVTLWKVRSCLTDLFRIILRVDG